MKVVLTSITPMLVGALVAAGGPASASEEGYLFRARLKPGQFFGLAGNRKTSVLDRSRTTLSFAQGLADFMVGGGPHGGTDGEVVAPLQIGWFHGAKLSPSQWLDPQHARFHMWASTASGRSDISIQRLPSTHGIAIARPTYKGRNIQSLEISNALEEEASAPLRLGDWLMFGADYPTGTVLQYGTVRTLLASTHPVLYEVAAVGTDAFRLIQLGHPGEGYLSHDLAVYFDEGRAPVVDGRGPGSRGMLGMWLDGTNDTYFDDVEIHFTLLAEVNHADGPALMLHPNAPLSVKFAGAAEEPIIYPKRGAILAPLRVGDQVRTADGRHELFTLEELAVWSEAALSAWRGGRQVQ